MRFCIELVVYLVLPIFFCLHCAAPAQIFFNDNTDWGTINALCSKTPSFTQTQSNTTFTMTMQLWTKLKIRAASAVMGCQSTDFPLREGIRPFYASEYFPSPAAREMHGYLLSINPIAFSNIVAVLNARIVCEMAADVSDYVTTSDKRQEWLLSQPLDAHNKNKGGNEVWLPSCNKKHGKKMSDKGRKDQKLSREMATDSALVGMRRKCDSSLQDSTMWGALFFGADEKGKMPSATKCPQQQEHRCIQCNELLPPSTFIAKATTNYNTLHNTHNTAKLNHPEQASVGMVTPAAGKSKKPIVHLVHADIEPLVKAALDNDPAEMRNSMMPSNLLSHLPGVMTAFNVMVSPYGLLQTVTEEDAAFVAQDSAFMPTTTPTTAKTGTDNSDSFSPSLRTLKALHLASTKHLETIEKLMPKAKTNGLLMKPKQALSPSTLNEEEEGGDEDAEKEEGQEIDTEINDAQTNKQNNNNNNNAHTDNNAKITNNNNKSLPQRMAQAARAAKQHPTTTPTTKKKPKDLTYTCPQTLIKLFEPEPSELTTLKSTAWKPFLEKAMGGKENYEAVTERLPTAAYVTHWPAYAGSNLKEWAPQNTKPNRAFWFHTTFPDDAKHQHTACTPDDFIITTTNTTTDNTDSEAKFNSRIPVYEEVVVLHTGAKAFHWFATDFIGRLAMLAPYLRSNPHVRVHIPKFLYDAWNDTMGLTWLDGMGISGWSRIVTGRIIARIAHVPDRLPLGSISHPLQYLALRDLSHSILASPQCTKKEGQETEEEKKVKDKEVEEEEERLKEKERLTGAVEKSLKRVMMLKRVGDRIIQNSGKLVASLHKKRLNVTEFAFISNWKNPCQLRRSLRDWAEADVVIGAHGSGFANIVAMKPGRLVIEISPQPLSAELEYMVLSHYLRLNYRLITTAGMKEVKLKVNSLHIFGTINEVFNTSFFAKPKPVGIPCPTKIEECLPPSELTHLGPNEPMHSFIALPRISYLSKMAKPMKSLAWISKALPLSEAKGIAVIPVAGMWRQSFLSVMPNQRKLYRLLESKGILPVALPSSFTEVAKKVSDLRDDCFQNEDLKGAISMIISLTHEIQLERGLSNDTYIPIYVMGLSSGAIYAGFLSSYIRIEGVLAQLTAPWSLLDHIEPNSHGAISNPFAEGKPCHGSPIADMVPEWLRAVKVPKIWVTVSVFNVKERDKVKDFLKAMKDVGIADSQLMTNNWLPYPVTYESANLEAPWLVSKRASKAIVDTHVSLGVFHRSAYLDSVFESCDIVCTNNTYNNNKKQHQIAKNNNNKGPFFHHMMLRDKYDEDQLTMASLHVLESLKTSLVFVGEGKAADLPYFFAGASDPEFPKDKTPLSATLCYERAASSNPGGRFKVFEPCQAWKLAMNHFLWIFGKAQEGWHNYHASPWEEIVDWVTSSPFLSTKKAKDKDKENERKRTVSNRDKRKGQSALDLLKVFNKIE